MYIKVTNSTNNQNVQCEVFANELTYPNYLDIDWEKAMWSGVFAFGLSSLGNSIKWAGDSLDVATSFILFYDYALLGIVNSIINVFWRGKKK